MTEPIDKLTDILDTLNSEAYELAGSFHQAPFELRTNGDDQCIYFLGETLWSSSDDDRSYDSEEPQDISDFLRERADAFLQTLTPLKFRK